jgi:aryl-alcohol dehydrogenase-like predicted oxidoreductase
LEHKIGVIVYSPMASGLLSGAMTRERIAALPEDDWAETQPELSGTAALPQSAAGRKATCDRPTLQRDARRGSHRNPAVTGAIVGVRSAHQATGIAGAADVKLSADDMLEIEQGLTRQAA